VSDVNLSTVPDGGDLRALAGGIVIIRRMKHEWREDFDTMEQEKLRVRTSKKWGSKFLDSWPVDRQVNWMERLIVAAGWRRQGKSDLSMTIRLQEYVGLADGEKVHTIKIMCDGHYAHAFPVKD
jgi:hypothetical protein